MSKYKTGDKFIIEIKETIEDGVYFVEKLYSARVNDSVLDDLEKYDLAEDAGDSNYFQEGVDFAQRTYKKLTYMSGFEISEIFKVDGGSAWAVIQKFSVNEIDRMIANHECNIHIGDKFAILSKDGNSDKIIVTYIDKDTDTYYYIFSNGRTGSTQGTPRFTKMIHKRLSSTDADTRVTTHRSILDLFRMKEDNE